MENINYDLVKLLHNALDDHWRLKKHYLNDASGACRRCAQIFKKMMTNHEEMVEMLKEEMSKHVQEKAFK